MRRSRWSAVFLVAASCGSFPQPSRNTDGAVDGIGDAVNDSPRDATVALTLAASPSSFVLHANDTRDTLLTVTNPTDQTSGTPMLAASGLTLGTVTFSSNTCTSGLAPGSSCAAVGRLTATTAGNIDFQVTATASNVMGAMASLPMTVTPACPSNCGPAGTSNCCASSVVPGNATGATLAGATFYRSYDVGSDNAYPNMTAPATVSDFRLDTYEVTVGRFRAFVNAGNGTQSSPPSAGAGAHAKIPGSGWDSAWNGSLAADTAALKAGVKCNATYQTWTDTAVANEALPMNCISWYEAMAFCIWDGGYLATEAEWNYAASGGSEQRAYPWSIPASLTTIDCSYANYFINSPAGTYCANGTTGATNRVGSEFPKGDGKWGQSDLAGNVFEWTLDWYASYTTPCNDCAHLATASDRLNRGGSFGNVATILRSGYRNSDTPPFRDFSLGVRCARTP